MGICRDEATVYLQRWGYNVVRHPREGIAPLDVIGRQRGTTAHLGVLDGLLARPGELPAVDRDLVAEGINGERTGSLHLGIGLSIVKSVLSAFEGGGDLRVAYAKAESLRITFANVRTDVVAPLKIGQFLNQHVLASDPLLDQYLLGDGQLYVITQTIKSNQITVIATAKDGTDLAVKVPDVQGIVGGNIEVTSSNDRSTELIYHGDKDLIFGFRCFEVGVDKGMFQLFASAPSAGHGNGARNQLLEPRRRRSHSGPTVLFD